MLKEQVAEILTQLSSKSHYFNNEEIELYLDSYVMQVCKLIKAEVDKLTVIDDEDIKNTHPYWWNISDNAVKRVRVVAEAQLLHAKNQLLDLMK